MGRRQPSDSLTVKDKIILFKAEIGDMVLTGNQLKIYHAFIKTTGGPTTVETVDKYGNKVRFKIYSNKNSDGSIHILEDHYKTNIWYVYAKEIVNLCSVIERGDRAKNGNRITYKLLKSDRKTKLTTALKVIIGRDLILKSFYSDR